MLAAGTIPPGGEGPPTAPATAHKESDMTTLSPCPETEQLRRFTALDLPENIHEQVEEHLRQCAECRRRVEGPDASGLASVGPGGDTLGTVAIRGSRPATPRVESGTHPLPDQTLEPPACHRRDEPSGSLDS